MFVVMDDPTALYIVGSALLCILCLTILVPVFLPKYISQRNASERSDSMMSSMLSRRQILNAEFSASMASNGGFRTSQGEPSGDLQNSPESAKPGRRRLRRTGTNETIPSERRLFSSPAPPRINRSQISSRETSVTRPEGGPDPAVPLTPGTRSGYSSAPSFHSGGSDHMPSVQFDPDTKS